MKQATQEAIDAKIALKLQLQSATDVELRIIEQKELAFDLQQKIAFLTTQKYLLQQRLDACAGRTNWSLSLQEEELGELQQVDLILSDVLSRIDVNELNASDIELVRLLGEVM